VKPRHKKFVAEYLKDENYTRACRAAGWKCKNERSFRETGRKLLKHPEIKEAIARAQLVVAGLVEQAIDIPIDAERTLLEVARVAYADISKALDGNGNVRPLDLIDPHTRAAIKSYRKRTVEGDKGTVTTVEITLHDKMQGIDRLMRHLGMLIERQEVSVLHRFQSMDDNELVQYLKEIQQETIGKTLIEHKP
jgi:hypothetical protein